MAKQIWPALTLVALLVSYFPSEGRAQTLEKVLITHSSDSISITPLLYGIEKNFYRKEGIDLSFRVLRGELAVSAIVSGKDVDYIYGAGTAFFAAVRGVPMKVFSHDFKSVSLLSHGKFARAVGAGPEREKSGRCIAKRNRGRRNPSVPEGARCGPGSGCDFDRHWRCFGAYGRYGGRVGGGGDYAGSLEYSNEAERLQRAYICR